VDWVRRHAATLDELTPACRLPHFERDKLPFALASSKGYRWVAVNGPYACVTEQDVRQITSDHTDLKALHVVENLRAYYFIPLGNVEGQCAENSVAAAFEKENQSRLKA
jgi:hypothetical protein